LCWRNWTGYFGRFHDLTMMPLDFSLDIGMLSGFFAILMAFGSLDSGSLLSLGLLDLMFSLSLRYLAFSICCFSLFFVLHASASLYPDLSSLSFAFDFDFLEYGFFSFFVSSVVFVCLL
ncbi:hypothetical protein TorRG33x02_146640, partial [Trema orientale]